MTPFAERDALMLRCFAGVLLILVVSVGIRAPSRNSRVVTVAAAVITALVSYLAVFVSLFAG
jgi:hypothetical protein